MIWSAIERQLHPYISPIWLDTWRVLRARSGRTTTRLEPMSHPRRVFVDVSIVSRHDAGTGIQRVVRGVLSELIASSANDWIIQPIAATRTRPYHAVTWLNAGVVGGAEAIDVRPGDIFLGLDCALDAVRSHRRQLADFKSQGGELWFLVYDLLPSERPEWFSDKLVVRYIKWLSVLAALADGFFCISSSVEVALREQLAQRYGLKHGFCTHVLPMGGDLAASHPSRGLPVGFDELLQRIARYPTALMVGTLEPRKGHAEVLAAFELLWQQGSEANFVIVGRPGWHTEEVQLALRSHPQYGCRLYWLEDASDEALEQLYVTCHGVITASYSEGFGLPLIEALAHGKSVLARDIPVFRTHEDKGVRYFDAESDSPCLAGSIAKWLAEVVAAPPRLPAIVASWADTARSILGTLAAEH